MPRPHQIVDLVEALVVAADLVEPPHDVALPIGPGHADVLADGDRHLAPGAGSSSASCRPVAEAPTTSTGPGRAGPGRL